MIPIMQLVRSDTCSLVFLIPNMGPDSKAQSVE